MKRYEPVWDIIDLSHPLTPGMPRWPGDPATVITAAATLEQEGFALNCLSIGEHSGTHAGAPRHFLTDGRSIADFTAAELVMPVAKIVYPAERDTLLAVENLWQWEARHGALQAGTAMLVETGWSRFWPEAESYLARDAEGRMHFPGISEAAMRFLVEHRRVRIVGIDSPGLDGGLSTTFGCNRLLARHDGLHLENLTGLATLPSRGAWLVIGALPIAGGSGAPARVLALVPKTKPV